MADTDQAIKDLAKGLHQLSRAVQSLAQQQGDDEALTLAKRAQNQTRDHLGREGEGATPRE
jgi:hypothetical protein